MAASNKKQVDLCVTAVIAFVTAIGGGTVRDLLIGNHPVSWMLDVNYLYVIFGGFVCSIFLRKYLVKLRKTLFLFDTLGIGLFTILGMQKTLGIDVSPLIAVLMGTVSAVFGGLIRDVLCNEIPLIIRKEVYATACLTVALAYYGLLQFQTPPNAALLISMGLIITLRLLAVLRKWSLPVVH